MSAGANNGGNAGEGETSVDTLALGDVRIIDGKATYTDETAGSRYVMDRINVGVVLDTLQTPLKVEGTLNFQGAPTKLDIVMTTLGQFLKRETTDLKFAVDLGETSAGGNLKLDFPGQEDIRFDGSFNLRAPDLPALASLAGTSFPETPGFDRLFVSGALAGSPSRVRLNGAKITFDDIVGEGDLQLTLGGARPKATGNLAVNVFDLRPYMPEPEAASEGFPAWSEEKLDFTGLRTFDADLDISAQEILLNQMKFGESRMALVIENGRLTADIPELSMYKGNGSGRVVVNARQAVPSYSGNFKIEKVDAEPFSNDVLNIDRILGLGGFTFDFAASGTSQAAIMQSIDGGGNFDVVEGALKGVDLGKLARVAYGFADGVNPVAAQNAIAVTLGPTETTDFSSFLSNFSMEDGLITARTIQLVAPFVSVEGDGTANLFQQTQNIRLNIQAKRNADGSGDFGPTLPLAISGTFSKPTIDYGQLITGLLQGIAGDRVRGAIDDAVGDRLKDSPAGGLLDSVLDRATGTSGSSSRTDGGSADNDNADQNEDAESELDKAAKDALGALFKRGNQDEEKDEEDPENR